MYFMGTVYVALLLAQLCWIALQTPFIPYIRTIYVLMMCTHKHASTNTHTRASRAHLYMGYDW